MDPLQLRQLKERCLELGMQKSQVQSKTFEAAVHFLSTALLESDGAVKSELEEARAIVRKKEAVIAEAHAAAGRILDDARSRGREITSNAQREANVIRANIEDKLEAVERLDELQKDTNAAICRLDELKAEILSMETPQARDAIRKAEYFKTCVNIQTTQNNTAFINAMGNVLSISVPAVSDEVCQGNTRRVPSPAELKQERY